MLICMIYNHLKSPRIDSGAFFVPWFCGLGIDVFPIYIILYPLWKKAESGSF